MSKSIEQMALEKIRKILIADSTIKGYASDRVYASHISSIDNPVYPAISQTVIHSAPRIAVSDMVDATIQIDLWFESGTSEVDMVLECGKRVRDLLHLQNLTDSAIGVTVGRIAEVSAGPMIFEEDTKLFHWPIRYSLVAL